MAISKDGARIFVTGRSPDATGKNEYLTIAYSTADGEMVWATRYSTALESQASALALSADGQRLYVTGYSAVANAAPPAPAVVNYDYATVAYDVATGNQLWVARYEGPAAFWDIAYSIAVANVRQPDGSKYEQVFATGRSNGASANNSDADYATVAYDGHTGAQLWVSRYDGPGRDRDLAYAVGVSPDGASVFVTGESVGNGTTSDYATVSYDALTGAQRWIARYEKSDLDLALALAVSPSGNRVAVTGFSVNDGALTAIDRSVATILYDAATGAQVWEDRHGETDGAAASKLAFSHDGRRLYAAGLENGNVIGIGAGPVGGQVGHAPALTVAYDVASGGEIWATHYSGPAGDEGNSSVVVSPDDAHVYVTGGGQSQGADFATISYATGALSSIALTSDWISPLGLTPAARTDAAMVYDAARQQMLLFGGSVGGGGLSGLNNETWLLRSGNWKQAGPQNFPFGRANPGIAYDAGREQIVLFGGYTASSIQFGDTNDTWIWNGRDWSQIATSATTTLPPVREAPAMAYFPDAGLTILFGGYSSSNGQNNTLNDTWAWNGSAWTQLNPATSPPARYGATLVYDAAHHKLVLFGGNGFNDTWTWDGTIWKQENPAVRPSIRSYSAATYDVDLGVVLLYGGIDASGNPLDDTWTWDGSTWTQLQPAHSPGARGDAVLDFNSAEHRAFLFGGGTSTTAFGDTWAFDGADWISLGQATQPSPRIAAPMAYDPRAEKTILFGGFPSFGVFNDTWQWNGIAWTQLHPANTPPPRGYVPLVDDPALNQLILFGGFGAGGLLNDTWAWDGSNWLQYLPAHAPPARTNSQIAFDGSRLLVYGGYDGRGAVFNDTWAFDGTDWAQLTPANSPPTLNGGAMAYDPIHHQSVLFGGSTGSPVDLPAGGAVPSDQTWTWDGATWTQQHPAHNPPATTGHSMVFDASLGGIVLFNGGQSVTSGPDVLGPKGLFNNQLWLWNGSDWTQITTPTVPGPRGFESLGYDAARGALVLFGGNGVHGIQGDTWTFQPPPLQLLAVKSRKIHGLAGTYDVDLALSGKATVECRSGGANGNYELVFVFANPLTSVADATISSGTGAITNRGIGDDPREYIVDLTGVTNAQTITVTLSNVYDALGNWSSIMQTRAAILIGDTTADGVVNSGDIAQTKSQSGSAVTSSNFREDVTTDGNINSGDIGLVKSKSGTALPQ